MDPLSLFLGIAPLCISAIKGIKAAKSTLKTLRHSKSELKRIRKKFTKETHIFLDECHLLLQEIIDPDDVVFMIEEPDNRLWSSSELDEQIKAYLGRRHDDFKDVMQDIHDNIISLDGELSLVAQETTETTTSKRIKGAIDVTHHKSKWLSKIDNISELNQDLKRLRKTTKQIRHVKPKIQKEDTKQMPTYYEYLSPYTKSFYQALTQNWSCAQMRHGYHDLTLFLGQAGETVDFLMRQRSVSGFKTITDTVNLSVISQKLATDRPQAPLTPCSSVGSLSSCDGPRPTKRLKAKEADEISQASTLTASATTTADSIPNSLSSHLDLSQSEDVCGTICQKANTTLVLPTASVLYIDHTTGFRHVLGHGTDVWSSLGPSYQNSFPLLTVLQQPVANNLSIPDQLQLALTLARGMLLFNPSPWWRSYWSLENVYYFPSNNDDTDLAKSLQTVHLSAEIDARHATQDESYLTGRLSPAEPQDAGEARLLYGIRNLALYSLGVALLQIDRWSTMNADDVVAIRRLARQTSRLGPRFQEVVQKCVDCDFGQGDDLEKPMLRNAVYGSVICEIEDLIRRISEK